MFHAWSPNHGVAQRLFIAALAALLALTMLVVIPGNVGQALADPPGSTYTFIFANADGTGPGITIGPLYSASNDVTVMVDGTEVGPLHLSCSENFNLYDDKFDHTVDRSGDDWGYSEGSGAPSKADGDPRLWDFRISRDEGRFAGTFCGFGDSETATLRLVKTVDGGTLEPSDFPVTIDDNLVEWGLQYELAPGSYTATEEPQSGYSAGDWGTDCAADGSVTLAAGDALTCTITNTFQPPPPVPSIDIEKATNDVDADAAPGPSITVGDTVTWTYVVTNDGEVDLTGVVITDDILGDVCTIGNLAIDATETCELTAIAVAGQYTNIGTATDNNGDGSTVSDTDPSHYLGTAAPIPSIDIEKATNDVDADAAPGPSITVGDTVTWTYVVTNDGEVDLTGVVITDDILGDVCTIGNLAIDATETCELTGIAVAGQYTNIGTATDNNGDGSTVSDTDPSHYFGQAIAASATIGDFVWNDENGDGVQDAGEKGIAGATVKLTLPDGTTANAVTNANGLYLFSGLEAGTYTAELVLSSIPDPAEGSNTVTTPSSFTIDLADAESYLDADFGIVSELPKTGLSTDSLTLIALALLLAGGVAIVATRKQAGDASTDGSAA